MGRTGSESPTSIIDAKSVKRATFAVGEDALTYEPTNRHIAFWAQRGLTNPSVVLRSQHRQTLTLTQRDIHTLTYSNAYIPELEIRDKSSCGSLRYHNLQSTSKQACRYNYDKNNRRQTKAGCDSKQQPSRTYKFTAIIYLIFYSDILASVLGRRSH